MTKPTQNDVMQTPPQEVIDHLLTLYNQGQLAAVVERAQTLIEQYPSAFFVWNILGAANKGLGRTEDAANAFKRSSELNPTYAEGFNNLGVTLQEQGKLEEAITAYNKALSLKPDDADTYYNMGNALQEQGKLDEAIAAYNKALSLKPDYAQAYNNLGSALQEEGKLDEAIAAYNEALSLNPDYADAYNNLGNALQEEGKLDEAIAAYKTELSIKPDYAEAYNNLGNALQEQGKLDEAIAAYNEALSLNPEYADAYNNLGNALQEEGKLDEAITAYNKALSLKPDSAEAYYNLGNALKEQGKLDEAITAYNKALSLKPVYAVIYNNLGNALKEQGKLDEAVAAYNKALSLNPDYAGARAQYLHQLAHICDWSSIEADKSCVKELGIIGECVPPFTVLPLEDAPERHRLRSELFVREKLLQKPLPATAKTSQKPERLRIGYFSADFHNHATMYLMAQIFALHDKSRFELFAYSYGTDGQDEMRKKLVRAVDVFHDVREMNDRQIVDLAREDKLDIAIDLKGFTTNARLSPFAYGLAPIQVSYLGYPGTLGADFIDYMVADAVVIPDDKRLHYSEQIIYLPNTYQPTDNTRIISDKIITREEMGLPSNGFVFCCFNNNYKISPKEFDIWMRLLCKVEGSVLWLLKSNKWAEQNLKREAEARGISSERLIFAERVPQAEHLARQKLSDLFLDTFSYNAHTTTSDALWVGLPVVTKLGEGFAARVAGSLLTAIGLPELITKSEKGYEALALTLATDPNELAKIRSKLEANRLTQPLFDSEMYTRHLETGYQMAYDRYFTGHSPDTIVVAA